MGEVVRIGQSGPKKRRPIKGSDAANSYSIACRVPASVFRRITGMVESPLYPEFKTKSDFLIEGIDLAFEKWETQVPHDPGWTPLTLEREMDQRDQRDEQFRKAEKRLEQIKFENDREGAGRLLAHCRKLIFDLPSNASSFEIKRINTLIAQIELTLGQ